MDVHAGQTQNVTINGLGSAYAQTVTYDVQFEGAVTAVSANPSVATVDPPSVQAVHDPGAGTKYATFTITGVAPGTTTVTITDKQGGSVTIDVTVAGTHGVLVADLYNNLIEEYPAGANGNAAPAGVLQAALQPRQMAVDGSGNVYVTSGSTVQVFAPGAASPSRTIRGNAAQLNCAQSIAVDAAGDAYVSNCGPITIYAAGANGNVAPLRTLNVPNSGPGEGIAVDGLGNLYVYSPNNGAGWINVYAPGASGSAAPVRQITSAALDGLYDSGNIAADAAGDVYVLSWGGGSNDVLEFAAGSNGNVAPSAINTTTAGYYVDSNALATDGAGNVWMTAACGTQWLQQCVYEFAPHANGQATPLTSFTAPGLDYASGIAADANGNVYVDDNVKDAIDRYPSTASGSASPTSTASLGVPGIAESNQIALAPNGKIYAANGNGGVAVYGSFQNGSPAPQTIIGDWPNYIQAQGVAVDQSGTIYVTTGQQGGSVDVYAPGATAGSVPERVINGSSTALSSPRQIAVAPNGNILVTDLGNSTVTIYANGATGNAAPIATLGGSNTGISQPWSVGTDSAGNIYVGNGCCSATGVNVFAPTANGNATPIRSLNACGFAGSLQTDASGYLYVACGGQIEIFSPGASGNAQPFSTIYQSPSEGGFWFALAVEP